MISPELKIFSILFPSNTDIYVEYNVLESFSWKGSLKYLDI